MYGYIYKTTNKLNGKIYIGKKKGKFTEKYLGSGKYLRNAVNKYGFENFVVEKIEDCETVELQNIREKYWIAYYRKLNVSMYNIADGGEGGDTFTSASVEDRQKRTYKLQQTTNAYLSGLTKEQMQEIRHKAWETRRKNGNDKYSDECRKKMSDSHKGLKLQPETISKIVASRKAHGYKHSEETRQKISASNRGKSKNLSEEGRKKISESNKLRVGEKNGFFGKTHSDELKERLSELNKQGVIGMRGKHLSEIQKKHHSESMLGKNAGYRWMNNGQVRVKVRPDEVSNYLKMGYVFGVCFSNQKRIPWNKGLTATDDARVANYVAKRLDTNKRKRGEEL